jgi:hypothetical protein
MSDTALEDGSPAVIEADHPVAGVINGLHGQHCAIGQYRC